MIPLIHTKGKIVGRLPQWPYVAATTDPLYEKTFDIFPLFGPAANLGHCRGLIKDNGHGSGVYGLDHDDFKPTHVAFGGTDEAVYVNINKWCALLQKGWWSSFWIRTTSTTGQFIMGHREGVASNRLDARINVNASSNNEAGKFHIFASDSGSRFMYGATTNTISFNDGTWNHIAWSVPNGSTLKIWFNGIPVATTVTQTANFTTFQDWTAPCGIGGWNDGGSPSFCAVADVADARFGFGALNDADAWHLFSPETRWSAYEEYGRKKYFIPSGAAGWNGLTLLGVG